MKIGLSLSRCVRDIVEGRVSIDDVLVIIARTNINLDDDTHWTSLWEGYTGGSLWASPEWVGLNEAEVKQVTLDLWRGGLIHQPRIHGKNPARRAEVWLEAVLPSTELDANPAARAAWDHFQTVAGLTNVKLREDIK